MKGKLIGLGIINAVFFICLGLERFVESLNGNTALFVSTILLAVALLVLTLVTLGNDEYGLWAVFLVILIGGAYIGLSLIFGVAFFENISASGGAICFVLGVLFAVFGLFVLFARLSQGG